MGRPVNERASTADWSIIFDCVASEYGYTWEQFVGMTYKLLNACLEAIARRTHNQTAVLAAMHGLKMDLYKSITPRKSISKQQSAHAEAEALKLLKT